MKTDTLLFLSDSYLSVYCCAPSSMSLIDSYDLNDHVSMGRFEQWLKVNQPGTTVVLLDVSCEDYYEEPLPHVRGRDRGLLVSRKITKLFPSSNYAYAELSARLHTGRRDDIYYISGIADSVMIDPLIEILANSNIVVSGVYTLPQLAAELIKPIEHNTKLLLVTCEKEISSVSRYSFRQSFIVNEKLYFSRKTTVTSSPGSNMAEVLRKEIERTWQYLNNRRVLEKDSRMQVLLLLPESVSTCISVEHTASDCDYVYIDAAELSQSHGCSSNAAEPSSGEIIAFMLAKRGFRKSHYKPQRLAFTKKHQKVKQFLSIASVLVLTMALVFSGLNIMAGLDIKNANEQLSQQANLMSAKLQVERNNFNYNGPKPQKMQAMVALSEHVAAQSALPEPIYKLVSDSFSGFNELSLARMEWRSKTESENKISEAGRPGANQLANQAVGAMFVVSLFGELSTFTGDFRHAIDRIESLMSSLRDQEGVIKVEATRMPLDIDPSLNISRSLSDQSTPVFSIDVTLMQAIM